jgi:hypothetical protein
VYIHAGGAGQERERVCIVLVPAAAHTRTPGPHCRDIKLNLQRSLFAPGASSLSLSHSRSRLIHTHILLERQGERESETAALSRKTTDVAARVLNLRGFNNAEASTVGIKADLDRALQNCTSTQVMGR